MSPRRFRYRVSATTSERIVASAVVALSIAIAALGIWVFRSGRMRPGTSMANAILADRATLGFVRLLVIVVAVYTNLNRAREERDEANRLLWSFLHG
jgi:uncharacterized membrane protein